MPFPGSGYSFNNFDYMNSNNNLNGNFGNPFAGNCNSNNAFMSNLLFNKTNYYDNMLNNNDLSEFYNFDFSSPSNFNQSLDYNNISSNTNMYNPTMSSPVSKSSNLWNSLLSMLMMKKLAVKNTPDFQEENQAEEPTIRRKQKTSKGSNRELVGIANSQLGKKESDGSYHKFTNGHDVKWCAAFVAWCLRQNDTPVKGDNGNRNENWDCDKLAKNILSKNPDATVFDRQKGLTDTSEIKPGAIIFFSRHHSSKDYTHVGIVEKVKNGKIYTIEGNTSDKVGKKVYDINNKYVRTILNV